MGEAARLHAPNVAEQNQEALDQLLEVGQRIRLIGKMLWTAEDMGIVNKDDLGTVALMLAEQADNLSATLATLELRLAEVQNG